METRLENNLKEHLNGLKLDSENSEVEIRLWHYDETNTYKPGITWNQFVRLSGELESEKFPVEHLTLNDTIYEGKGKDKIRERRDVRHGVIWILKKKLKTVERKDDCIRLTHSIEIPTTRESVTGYAGEPYTRSIERKSYFLERCSMRIDLSKVTSSNDSSISYEAEFEFIEPSSEKIDSYVQGVLYALKIYKGTDIYYTHSERVKFASNVNNLMFKKNISKKQPAHIINTYSLTRPRNLEFSDLTYGNIVGGDLIMNCSYKTDGVRKLLIFTNNGIWMCYGDDFNKLSEMSFKDYNILDVEYIPESSRREGAPHIKHWIQVIDILYYKGDNVSNKFFNVRQGHVLELVAELKDQIANVIISNKRFVDLGDSVDDFFAKIRSMLSEVDDLNFATDGLIFTPVNHGYYMTDRFRKSDSRYLNKENPAICKWKPPEQLTIDFRIARDGSGRVLLEQGNGEVFEGDNITPFDVKTQVQDTLNGTPLQIGTIVEFAWKRSLMKFIPLRIRYDRTEPNGLATVKRVWHNIHDPISADDLQGYTFRFMKKFHNRVKSKLFETASTNKKKKSYLLDIGSGNGADISKWRDYKHIIAVEPNAKNIEELVRRVRTSNKQLLEKLTIIRTTGQDSKTILSAVYKITNGEKVDTISMMQSLTFFFFSLDDLSKLILTIKTCLKANGDFIWIALDGVRLYNKMSLSENDGSGKLTIQEKAGSDRALIESQKYKITFSMSRTDIVGGELGQVESLVIVDILREHLSFKSYAEEYVNGERFMSPSERELTELYMSGRWSGFSNSEPMEFVSYVVPNDMIYDNSNNYQDLGLTVLDDKLYELNDVMYATLSHTSSDCVLHAILLTLDPKYKDGDTRQRTDIHQQFRIDIIVWLTRESIYFKGYLNYECAGAGNLLMKYAEQLKFISENYPALTEDGGRSRGIDYSLPGLIYRYQEKDTYNRDDLLLMADFFEHDIHLVDNNGTVVKSYFTTSPRYSPKENIVLYESSDGYEYGTVAFDENEHTESYIESFELSLAIKDDIYEPESLYENLLKILIDEEGVISDIIFRMLERNLFINGQGFTNVISSRLWHMESHNITVTFHHTSILEYYRNNARETIRSVREILSPEEMELLLNKSARHIIYSLNPLDTAITEHLNYKLKTEQIYKLVYLMNKYLNITVNEESYRSNLANLKNAVEREIKNNAINAELAEALLLIKSPSEIPALTKSISDMEKLIKNEVEEIHSEI